MNRESREEVLARLLAGALGHLETALGNEERPGLLQDTADAGSFAGEVDAFIDDCREFVATLVETQWQPGEAPPGVEGIQAELKERETEERRVNRNKRKASDRKSPNRRGQR